MRYYTRVVYSPRNIASSIQKFGSTVLNIFVGASMCGSDGLMRYPSYKIEIDYNKVLELCKIKRWEI